MGRTNFYTNENISYRHVKIGTLWRYANNPGSNACKRSDGVGTLSVLSNFHLKVQCGLRTREEFSTLLLFSLPYAGDRDVERGFAYSWMYPSHEETFFIVGRSLFLERVETLAENMKAEISMNAKASSSQKRFGISVTEEKLLMLYNRLADILWKRG